jgi:hypothetical protein
MEENNDIRSRAGSFFVLIGIGLLILFFISDMYGLFNLWYFILGGSLTALGAFLLITRRPSNKPSDRFHGIRNMMAKTQSKDKNSKENKKK